MSDLTYIQSTLETKIVGQDSTGNNANYVGADSNGNIKAIDFATSSTGSVIPSNASYIGGKNPSGDLQGILTDTNGDLICTSIDGYKATYSAAIGGLVVAAAPTDIFTITGSATKTVRITRISISGTQNTSASRDILLIRRSSANSGGTSTSPTAVSHDSNNSAASVTIDAYTANPTSLGTEVGIIRSIKFQLLSTNVTNPLDKIEWTFGTRHGQAIVLRGTSQILSINLNSITSSSNLIDIDIEWTEE